jgi:Ca-activated chloride channel family protein
MDITDFHFIRPFWLLALIPFAIVLVLSWKNKLMQGNWSQVCDAELLPYILQQKATTQNRWPLYSAAMAGLITIIALAGPSWERLPAPAFRNASALVILLDLSRSMDAADIKPSRLIRARYKISDILKRRKDGQTALIVYAGDAFTVTPLTEDNETINSQLTALETEIMPSQGSDTRSALDKAVSLFKQAGLTRGQILLVTDGVILEDTLKVVRSLDAYQLSVLGVGTAHGAPIKISQGGFMKDISGNIVVPKLNSQDLQKLANTGGGSFRLISADDSDIDALLANLDTRAEQQEKEGNNLLLDLWQDQGPWLLLLVLPLAALSFRRGILCLALMVLLPIPKNSYALEWQDLWQSKDQQAQKNFNKQKFGQAATQFDDPEWKAAAHYKAGKYTQAVESLQGIQSIGGLYNKGNALARSGQLQEALQAYQQALTIDPKHEDTLHNQALVEQQLKKQEQDNKQQGDDQSSEQDSQSQKKQEDEQSDEKESSEQTQDQQSQQNKSEQDERSTDQQQSDEKQNQKQQADKDAADKSENKQRQAEQNQKQKEKNTEERSQAKTEQAMQEDENQQANEQWLQRIPDDPSGLLKRKFKYQYGKRKFRSDSVQAW